MIVAETIGLCRVSSANPFTISEITLGRALFFHSSEAIPSNIEDTLRKKIALDSTALKNHPYKFVFRREHHFPDTFRTFSLRSQVLDPYEYNFAQSADTFDIVLKGETPAQSFHLPLSKWRLTSGFGPRYMFGSRFHYGVDAEVKTGDSVLSVLPGVVRVVRNDRYGYGNFIVVAHQGGLETLYGHLSAHAAEPGQYVNAGDLIGYAGSTGRSTGPHLHFELRFLGEQFDPCKVISPVDGSLYSSRTTIMPEWYAHLNPNGARKLAQTHDHDHSHDAAPAAGAGTEVASATTQYYTVQLGDTLGHIALRYATSVQNICRLNGISPYTLLRPGLRLKIS